VKYYDAKKRINKKNDYPISKLEKIIPFLEKNYEDVIPRLKNDIIFLRDEQLDY
jgi:hypothetical protein